MPSDGTSIFQGTVQRMKCADVSLQSISLAKEPRILDIFFFSPEIA